MVNILYFLASKGSWSGRSGTQCHLWCIQACIRPLKSCQCSVSVEMWQKCFSELGEPCLYYYCPAVRLALASGCVSASFLLPLGIDFISECWTRRVSNSQLIAARQEQDRQTSQISPGERKHHRNPQKFRDSGNYESKSEQKKKSSDFIFKTLNTKFYGMKEGRRGVAALKSLRLEDVEPKEHFGDFMPFSSWL